MSSWKLFAAVALSATATTGVLGQNIATDAIKSFDYALYCNGTTTVDSIVGGPNGTRCFDSKQETVGVTDWFLTGQSVFDQFHNMDTEPFLCKVKFSTDPFRPTGFDLYEDGHFGAESVSNGVSNAWDIIVGDFINSYNWKDAGVALSNPGPVNVVKFFIQGESCIKNVMVACNSGATNGLGNVAVSVGHGFWENLFGTRGMPWTHCGPDGSGVKLVTPTSVAVYISPFSISGDFDRFFGASYLRIEDVPTQNINQCFSGEGKGSVVGMTWPDCININA